MDAEVFSEIEKLGQVRDVSLICKGGIVERTCLVIPVKDFQELKDRCTKGNGG